MSIKRIALILGLAACLLMQGCTPRYAKYSVTYWDTFDTVITITGYAQGQAAFDRAAGAAHAELQRLHAIFDRYNEYPGVKGLYQLNRDGSAEVAPELIEVIRLCQRYGPEANWRVNPAMGAALQIWHDYREQGTSVPPMDELWAAPVQREIEIQGDAVTLRPGVQLDLGAIAKGYAVEKAAAVLLQQMPSFLINGGGNVRAGDAPMDGRDAWSVGLTDPQNPTEILRTLRLSGMSAVTSGGYQRYYEVNGTRYHHIIDPDTLMPAELHLQATVLTEDSALADYLSTALFLLPYEQGRSLAQSLGADAIWVEPDGTIQMTDGAKALLTNEE